MPLPIIPLYRPEGEPATAYIDIIGTPVAGNKVTINGTDFTFGTHWFGVQRTAYALARTLAEAIRGEPSCDGHIMRVPVRLYSAIAYGDVDGSATARIFLFATRPGTAGNSLTLTTNASSVFTVSGATFSGGTA